MLTHGGYPFFICKTIWEVKNATKEGKIESDYQEKYSDRDKSGQASETGGSDCLCGCSQIGEETQEIKE